MDRHANGSTRSPSLATDSKRCRFVARSLRRISFASILMMPVMDGLEHLGHPAKAHQLCRPDSVARRFCRSGPVSRRAGHRACRSNSVHTGAQHRSDRCDEAIDVGFVDDRRIRPHRKGGVVPTGHDDQRNVVAVVVTANRAEQIPARHVRHQEIRNDHRWSQPAQRRQQRSGASEQHGAESRMQQKVGDSLAKPWISVEHEHDLGRMGLAGNGVKPQDGASDKRWWRTASAW
jgi:hypothetical protein